MFAPAGQATARAGSRSELAALVVRRQAPGPLPSGKRPFSLTPREFDLLLVLVRAQGQALYRETLYERVWGLDAEPTPRALDLHIHRLRKKLNWADKIVTVPKIGYRLIK